MFYVLGNKAVAVWILLPAYRHLAQEHLRSIHNCLVCARVVDLWAGRGPRVGICGAVHHERTRQVTTLLQRVLVRTSPRLH